MARSGVKRLQKFTTPRKLFTSATNSGSLVSTAAHTFSSVGLISLTHEGDSRDTKLTFLRI